MNLIIAKGLKDALKPEIARLDEALSDFARQSDGFLGDLLSYVLINAGKRIRPALVILGSNLGRAAAEEVRSVEMAVEMIHIATLVHDDVIDKSALRRGKKTVVEQQGVDTAVLLGDYVYTKAFQMAAALGRPEVVGILAESTAEMCSGEIDQLKHRFQFRISESDYFSFIHKKTASLFGASVRCGAVLAGQPEEIQRALESYGVNLGIAFQIADDLLDLTGDEAVVGKTLRTDLANGKMTLPLIHHRNGLNGSVDELIADLQNPNGHTLELVGRIKRSGSIEYAEAVAHRHIETALNDLNALPPSATKEQLTSLAQMLWRRDA